MPCTHTFVPYGMRSSSNGYALSKRRKPGIPPRPQREVEDSSTLDFTCFCSSGAYNIRSTAIDRRRRPGRCEPFIEPDGGGRSASASQLSFPSRGVRSLAVARHAALHLVEVLVELGHVAEDGPDVDRLDDVEDLLYLGLRIDEQRLARTRLHRLLRPEKCGQPGAADVVDAAQVEHDHLHLRGQDALELGVETRSRLGIEPADQRDRLREWSAFL